MKTICTLTQNELSRRIDEINEQIMDKIILVKEHDSGFEFYCEPSEKLAQSILNFINSERKCCKSLRFELCFEPEDGNIILRITGPGGTKETIDSAFNIGRFSRS